MYSGAAVLIPVKDFSRAKARLDPALSPTERAALAEEMATTVVGAASPLPVVVVCDSELVRAWAHEVGARVMWTPGLGLNGAVAEGARRLASEGVEHVVVAHSDLPLATDFTWLLDFSYGATIVPDRHGDGTNVLCVPATAGFNFTYGPASSTRHRAEALRLGLATRIVNDDALSWDIDRADDLDLLFGDLRERLR